ncbi:MULTISPECIES: hypothetical protein [Halobacteriovorax]|uniref:MSP domain-containing protein n=1 Tax=Halobacteriovorax vibrionivorans TaxID=2152716 RepID=A0ABY0IIH8_9BACT|nr:MULTISPECIES: hypothetical protein [Halobacteriovorax]RZF21142.1 hypothetical protein DAY19_14280 [Halobacteriovorax vibrionivorans]TGD46261.1 hypothetical protein EP118_12735 [Halobacteriovorax sp. Y22]
MEKQVFKIASQKSNRFILVIKNLTSHTSVLEINKCHLVMLVSPQKLTALLPKNSCALGHRIELYIVQNSLVTKANSADLTKHEQAIKLTSEVMDIGAYNDEQNHVTFKVLEESKEMHEKIENVILNRLEKTNNLLDKFRKVPVDE